MKNKLIINYMYNIIYQILTICLPLVTIPYISKTLGVEQIGINAFTFSIVQYFIIFGTIGIDLYAKRTTAYIRSDKQKLSRNFWEISFLKIILTSISFIIFLCVFGFSENYRLIYLIQSINIIAAAIDITWFYEGLEDFKTTVTRNLWVKIIGIILIFVCVKNSDDLYKYVLINSLSIIIGQLFLWKNIRRLLETVNLRQLNVKQHIVPSLRYFLPQIAIQIYTLMDKTLLGVMTDNIQVGLYDQALKILRMILALVTASGTVMLPMISNMAYKKDSKNIKKYINNSIKFSMFLAMPITFGIAGAAKELVPWFFGMEFIGVVPILIIGSGLILTVGLSNVLGMQYLMALGKVRQFTVSVTFGAILNLILNLILIKPLGSVGAIISSVFTEVLICIIQLLYMKRIISVKSIIYCIRYYIIGGILLYISARLIGNLLHPGIITNLIQAVVGGVVYSLILIILKDEFFIKIINLIIKQKNKPL